MSARCNLEQMLASLDANGWQSAHLMCVLPQLRQRLSAASVEVQQRWMCAMQSNWERIGAQWRDGIDDLAFGLGVLAAEMRHWQVARDCFGASLAQRGVHHATLFNLAATCSQCGSYSGALDYLRRAIALAPEREHYRTECMRLSAWCTATPKLTPLAPAGSQIGATMLGVHHAAALHARQDDAALRRLARLEPCDSVDAARHWIGRQAEIPGNTTLALIHREHGLIGVLALARKGDAATFYYWISRSFQGQGHGSAALGLLKAFASKQGIQQVSSSVYADNERSIRAMQSAGFRWLPEAWEDVGNKRLPRFQLLIASEGQHLDLGATC